MIQKKNSNLILIIIIAILIIVVIALSIIFSQRSKKTVSETKTTTSIPQTVEQMQESENQNESNINKVVSGYINKKYTAATNIQTTVEYAGLGYAIMNTTYTFNEETVTKKIYLKQNADTWNFLYESDGIISCDIAREISTSDSILTLNCEE